MIFLTRRETFSASHRLYASELSPEQNQQLFGKCALPNGHGHNYVLEVTVCGQIDAKTGILINLSQLKQIVQDHLIDEIDHRHLNLDIPWLRGLNPTIENLAKVFFERLEAHVSPAKLYKIKLIETENNFAEYLGGGDFK